MPDSTSVDSYIAKYPDAVRVRLECIRAHVASLLPGADEKISYGIPTFKLSRNIFHYGAFTGHIGLYPGAAAIEAHASELAAFKTTKGAIQVPHQIPLPLELITRLVEFNLRALSVPRTRSPSVRS